MIRCIEPGAYSVDAIPLGGASRAVALARLRAALAADMASQMDALVLAGWSVEDIRDAAATHASWLHRWVAEIVDDGLTRWGGLP